MGAEHQPVSYLDIHSQSPAIEAPMTSTGLSSRELVPLTPAPPPDAVDCEGAETPPEPGTGNPTIAFDAARHRSQAGHRHRGQGRQDRQAAAWRRGALPHVGFDGPFGGAGRDGSPRRRAGPYSDGKRQDQGHHGRPAARGGAVRGPSSEGSRHHRRDNTTAPWRDSREWSLWLRRPPFFNNVVAMSEAGKDDNSNKTAQNNLK